MKRLLWVLAATLVVLGAATLFVWSGNVATVDPASAPDADEVADYFAPDDAAAEDPVGPAAGTAGAAPE
jgi:hypothetical protein